MRAFGPDVDLAGRSVPRGRCVRELGYPALTSPPPAWLTVTDGSGSFVSAASSLGFYRATGTGKLALRTQGVMLLQHCWVAVTFELAHWDSTAGLAGWGISLKDDSETQGAAIFRRAADNHCTLRLLGAGVPDMPLHYDWDPLRRINLTLAVCTADRSVWLAEDDQTRHYGTYPAMRLGQVRGVLDCGTTTAREMRIGAAKLLLETN